jgi:hypothetical protein
VRSGWWEGIKWLITRDGDSEFGRLDRNSSELRKNLGFPWAR